MQAALRLFLLSLVILTVGAAPVFSADPDANPKRIDMLGKISDHNYLDFKPAGKIELPRILRHDGQWVFYSSTTAALNSGDGWTDEYYLAHPDTVIYKEDGATIAPVSYELVRADGTKPSFDASITSHLVWFAFSGFLVLMIFGRLASKYNTTSRDGLVARGTFMNLFESLVIFVRDDIAKANIGEEKYMKYAPYLLSAFFMILFMNLFGLMPWGVTSTADVMITAVLALFTFSITQLAGSREYWKHVFLMPGVPKLMLIIITPVEILGLFTKPFALTVRLFANMVSGKLLVYSIIGMIFLFAEMFGDWAGIGSAVIWVPFTLFIYAIKIFASFLQAYIFTMFSALFIGLAAADHDHEHEHQHAH